MSLLQPDLIEGTQFGFFFQFNLLKTFTKMKGKMHSIVPLLISQLQMANLALQQESHATKQR